MAPLVTVRRRPLWLAPPLGPPVPGAIAALRRVCATVPRAGERPLVDRTQPKPATHDPGFPSRLVPAAATHPGIQTDGLSPHRSHRPQLLSVRYPLAAPTLVGEFALASPIGTLSASVWSCLTNISVSFSPTLSFSLKLAAFHSAVVLCGAPVKQSGVGAGMRGVHSTSGCTAWHLV